MGTVLKNNVYREDKIMYIYITYVTYMNCVYNTIVWRIWSLGKNVKIKAK